MTPARREAQCVSFLVLTATFRIETASAQTNTAEIAGVVGDLSGAVLPGATVTAIQPSTSIAVERTADVGGPLILPAMPIGVWNVGAQRSAERAQHLPRTMGALELRSSSSADRKRNVSRGVAVERFPAAGCRVQRLGYRVFGSPNFGRIFSAKNAREM